MTIGPGERRLAITSRCGNRLITLSSKLKDASSNQCRSSKTMTRAEFPEWRSSSTTSASMLAALAAPVICSVNGVSAKATGKMSARSGNQEVNVGSCFNLAASISCGSRLRAAGSGSINSVIHLPPCKIGRRPVDGRRVALGDRNSFVPREFGEVAQQARLADSRFTLDDDQATHSRLNLLELCSQFPPLPVSTDDLVGILHLLSRQHADWAINWDWRRPPLYVLRLQHRKANAITHRLRGCRVAKKATIRHLHEACRGIHGRAE